MDANGVTCQEHQKQGVKLGVSSMGNNHSY